MKCKVISAMNESSVNLESVINIWLDTHKYDTKIHMVTQSSTATKTIVIIWYEELAKE